MRKNLRFIIIALFVVIMMASFYACTADKDYGVTVGGDEATVDGIVDIALTTVKDKYYLGEFFDRSQYIVKIVLDTGEVKEIPFDDNVKVTGFNAFVVGKNTFTVSYGAASKDYTVDIIEPKVASVTLATMPDKTQYIEGEQLDVDGCTLDITLLETGVVVRVGISSGFVTGFDSVEMGKKDLIINFCGKQILLEDAVEVRPKSLVDVSVEKMPTITSYLTNGRFEKEGMVLLLTYDNDDTELVDVQGIPDTALTFDYQFTSANSNSPVTVNYTTEVLGENKTFSMIIYCSVSDKLLRSNNPIELVSSPTVGTELLEGREDMDYAGGKLRVYYQTPGDEEIIDMTSPIFTKTVYKDAAGTIKTDLREPGNYYVRFSYYRNDSLGWYYNMPVTVKQKTATAMTLTSTAEAVNTKYYAGLSSKVNINSLKYILSYNNYTVSEPLAITEDMLMEGSTLTLTEGAGSIDITNDLLTLSYENYQLDNSSIKSTTGKIVGNISYSSKSFTVDGDTYTYDDTGMVYGYKKIAFMASGVSAVLKVMIYKEEVISMSVSTTIDNAFILRSATTLQDSLEGLSLRVKYNHGGEKTIFATDDSDIKVTFSDGSTNPSVFVPSLDGADYKAVPLYISYKGCSTTINGKPITIDAYITDISATALVTKGTSPTVAYIYGDKVKLLGMSFTVDMGGTTETVEVVADNDLQNTVVFMIDDNPANTIELSKSAFVCSNDYAVTTTGAYKFNYFGAIFDITMTVTPLSVSSIVVKNTDKVKTIYNIGEPFLGLDGIELSSVKNNGAAETVTPIIEKINSESEMYRNGYYYIFRGMENETGTKTISIFYKENNNIVTVDYKGVLYKGEAYVITDLALYDDNTATTSLGSVAAGMSLNLTPFRLYVQYEGTSTGTTVEVESSMLDYDQNHITPGERAVKLTYGGRTLDLTVNVVKTDLLRIEVDKTNLQLNYIVGSTFSYAGGYIRRFYDESSGLKEDVVPLSEGKVTGFDSNITFAAGADESVKQTLTVEYGYKTTTIDVVIWNKRVPDVKFSGVDDVRYGNGADPVITIQSPAGTDIFEAPSYTIRYQFMLPNGNWQYIDENNSYYTYYLGKDSSGIWQFDNSQTAFTYQTRDLKPHHVGTYRIVFNTEGNEYYEAVTDESITCLYTISPTQSITFVADSKVSVYGDDLLPLTYTVAGNTTIWDSTINDLKVSPVGSLELSVEDASEVDQYAILQGTLEHPYFIVKFESSTYTINPAVLTVTPVDLKNIHFTGTPLGDTILFDVVKDGKILFDDATKSQLTDYFEVSFIKDEVTTNDLTDKGYYTMVLTAVKGTRGNYNYTFTSGETTTYTLSFDFEVRRKKREFRVSADRISVVKDGDNYVFTFDFTGYEDLGSLAWTTSILDEGFTETNTVGSLVDGKVTLSKDEVTNAQYQRFRFKYLATEDYEESASLIVDVTLP